MKCIILAGGFATRLWPLSENKAKPLLHLKDRPIVSHLVEGIPEDIPIAISTNAVFEKDFKAWAKGYPDRDIRIFVEDSEANETKKGALGAVALAIQRLGIDEDLLLIAGDNYFGFRISDFTNSFKGNTLLAAFELGDLGQARKFGVVVAKKGHIVEFQEKPQEPKSTLVSTGCYVFPRKNLKDIVEFARKKKDDLGGIFEHLLKQGETIDVFSFPEPWYDIGSFDGYLKANRELIGDRVIEMNGVTQTGKNTLIGAVYLGDHVVVEDSVIENSVILKNCAIHDCVIRNCIIDEGCTLSGIDLNRQMIRHGSVIRKTNG
jgi:glucose-1-phosphate thymidylyltransferase